MYKSIFSPDPVTASREIVKAVGMIADNVDYTKWEPVMPFAMRQMSGIIGADVTDALVMMNRSDNLTEAEQEVLQAARRCAAFFAWVKVTPTLDAQHGGNGRQRKLGENEKGLTALQEYKDEQNILNLSYEAADALLEMLENYNMHFWENSQARRMAMQSLIPDKETFDRYYRINSHRLFYTLVPIIREVQRTKIEPVIGRERMEKLLEGDPDTVSILLEECQRPLALLSLKKAVQRLPIELIPEGVVQVQQAGTLKEKLRAEKEARQAVANSLADDAEQYLQELQDTIRELTPSTADDDLYLPRPTLQSKGISF